MTVVSDENVATVDVDAMAKAMYVDAMAKAMYQCRQRRIPWEDLTEVGWKAEYRRMAAAAVQALGLHVEERTLPDGGSGVMTNWRTGETTRYVRPQTRQRRWVSKWVSLARV